MRVLLESGKFILHTTYDEKFKASACGGKWDQDLRIWSVKASILSGLGIVSQAVQGDDVEAARAYLKGWDEPPPLVVPATREPLMPHQVLGSSQLIHRNRFFITFDMGCVDGEAVVRVNRAGKGFAIALKDLFHRFHGGKASGHSWDPSIPTYIRSLCNGELRLNKVVNVLDKGIKSVVCVRLKSGKSVRVTEDHEICVGQNKFVRADKLKCGDTVLTNGKFIDKDGYVRIANMKDHPRCTTGGLYEHILVAEKMLGRRLRKNERVHHKNEIKSDNKESNLEVLTHSGHAQKHGREGGYRRLHGGRGGRGGLVTFVPSEDKVASVRPDGEAHVYDVVCVDPHRNFVANGVIVHNCGKTLTVIGAAQELFKDGKIDLVLIVAPLSVFASWERQVKRFCGVEHRVLTLTGSRKERVERMDDIGTLRKALVKKRLIFALVNYEALRLYADDLIKLKPGMFVADESSFIKNRSAQMTRAAARVSRAAKYATALTGTPISNNVGDLFGQLHAVSSEFVGDDYWHFIQSFATFGGYKNKEIVGSRNLKALDWIMKKCSMRVRKDEVLQLPELTQESREIILEGDQKEAYDKAATDFYFAVEAVKKTLLELEGKEDPEKRRELVTVLIKNAMTRLLRCQQIAGGHCKSEIGETIYWPENPKVRELVQIAEQSGDQRIVVFSRFIEDLEQGRKALEEAGVPCVTYHGSVKREERARIENEFLSESTPLRVVLTQVKTGGFGIDFSRASIAVFYNNWFSWAVRDQAQSRLHRLGQKRNVLCIDLLGVGTVDEAILSMVLSKRTLSEVLFGKKVAEAETEIDRLDEIVAV